MRALTLALALGLCACSVSIPGAPSEVEGEMGLGTPNPGSGPANAAADARTDAPSAAPSDALTDLPGFKETSFEDGQAPVGDAQPIVDGPPPDLALPDGPVLPMQEVCNGRDDDLDDTIDEGGLCGVFMAESCRIVLVWSDLNRGTTEPSERWGPCDVRDVDLVNMLDEDALRCVSTSGDQLHHFLPFTGNVNEDDHLGVAFVCDPAAGGAGVSAFIESACEVFLGQDDTLDFRETLDSWDRCPGERLDVEGPVRCVSSGGDGLIHAMPLSGDVNHDDDFGIAFRCGVGYRASASDRAWAAQLQASAFVVLGLANDVPDPLTPSPSFGQCPGEDRDGSGAQHCVSSNLDGRFRGLPCYFLFDWDIDANDALTIALLATPAPPAPQP
ncbi:MAG: hypothetical protein EXR76_04660 [Myxococcales bacterium]|nr:hypothetical protein [Myxococcales bacterium]